MSYTQLRYHIITATMGRARLLTEAVERIAHAMMIESAEKDGAKVLRIGGVEDHVHLVVAVPPTVALADFVRNIKATSSGGINRVIPRIDFAGQEGYGAFTLSPFDLTAIIRYVADQKEHHRTNILWPRYEKTPD